MAARAAGESRLRSYKTKGLDVEEVRRRREEEGVLLRKSRREEQVQYDWKDVDEKPPSESLFSSLSPSTALKENKH